MSFSNLIKTIVLIVLLTTSLIAQNHPVFSEIMFYPSGDGNKNEYVELFNPTNQAIDLSDYRIKVATFAIKSIIAYNAGSTVLQPNQFAVVIEGDYDPVTGPYNFPPEALIVTINSTTFGPMANTSDRPLYLLNSGGDTLSVYTYSANNAVGYSDEKIILNSDNSSSNWANSLVFDGTPGYKNSVSPKEKDMAITEISVLPEPIIENVNLTSSVKAVNLGTLLADTFELSLYIDVNFDSTPQPGELVDSYAINSIASGDSIIQNFDIGLFPEGQHRLIAVVVLAGDEASFNDTLIYNFTVLAPPPPFNAIVINEIMYAPSTGEPEWVEIYNNSNQTYNLANWKFADFAGSAVITVDPITIDPGEFIVLAKNANIEDFFDIDATIIVMNLPILNNDWDRAVLMDNNSFVIDSLTYQNSWGGTGGRSLERIDYDSPSHDPANWGTAVTPDRATPGKVNSISPKDFDLALTDISISPSPPIEGVTLTAQVKVNNPGYNNANTYSISLYNDINFDATPQPGELINTVNLNNLASGDSVIQNFNLGSFSQGDLQLIGVVYFGLDEDDSNNELIKEFEILPPPPPFNAIVINEIMYAPSTGEPEWVEISNNSNQTYNLANWKFADFAGSAVITVDPITIDPGEFIVLAKNANIEDFFDIDATIIVMNLPILNNDWDRAVLMDNNSFVIDSLTYQNSWGGTGGRSLERIDYDSPSHDPNNWGTAVTPDRATPGKINSISPKDFDLALTDISISPSPPIEGVTLTAQVKVNNPGYNNANTYSISLYNDINFDATPQPGELINTVNLSNLASGDSVIQNFNLGSYSQGDLQLIGVVNFGLDEDESNNELIKEFEILTPPPPFNAIVINEIMYAPPTGEPEWVEIYNNSNQTYNLANWKFADFSGSAVITVDPITIDPGEFIVLAKNATISDFFDIDATIIVMNLPVLNNDWDRTVLMDNNSFVIDSLTYQNSWGGTGGRSLERIDYDSPSHDPNNWGTAVTPDRATPGKVNSISPKDFDLALTDINITPSPPIEGVTLTAQVKVNNPGYNNANTYSISLYNDINFDAIPQPGELINTVNLNNLASGDSVIQNFNLGSFSQGDLQLIGVVNFGLDEDDSNNELVKEFEILPPPPPFNAVIINEIMYAPPTGEPEWVEIYNNSNQTYNLANWRFADFAGSAVITVDPITIDPGEFIVLAKNATISDFFDIDATIIVMNLPILNNDWDRAVLMDNNSFVIDSLTYQNSWGGTGGRSLERIDYDSLSHNPNNWGTSTSPHRATPGAINSLTPKDHDLAITEISISPSPPIENEVLTANLIIENLGRLNALSFTVNLYNDTNFDGIPQQNELIESQEYLYLASGNSFVESIDLGSFPSMNLQLIGEVIYNEDEDLSNNRLILEFVVYPPPPGYNDIVINEIMYAPLSGSGEPEWVEIYNRSENTYLLTNWKFADASGSATITNEFITIDPLEYIVLAKDSSILNFYNINAKIIVMNLPVLNNTGDDVILLNEYSIVIDSLRYSSSWGGSNGKSLERIDVFGESTSQNNWAQSISSAGATPGQENSVVPREFDLAVTHFNSVNSFLLLDEPSVFNVRVRNNGISNISGGVLNIYFDINNDSLFTEEELIESFTGLTIEAGQEITEQLSYIFNSVGTVGLLAAVNHPSDNYQPNDSVYLYKEVVKPHVNRGEIVINEFMYAPTAPYPEWIELYNASSTAFQLRNFQIADLSDTVVISTQNILLPANSYIVIARDSIITMLYDIPSQVIIRSFPVLNNSGDRIMLLDNFDRVIDSLNYTSQWGGTNGRSLERINPFGSSTEASNWITSTDPSNGTPGKINSVAPKDYDVAIKKFYSDPEQPVAGETVMLFVDLINDGLNTATFDLKLFESNSSSEKVSFLEVINIENLTPGETRTVKFNYQIEAFIDDKFFIAEADYPDDQDISNNFSLLFISSTVAPLSLIINEIMYAPEGDEPEWIELYNNSDNAINLKDWLVSDVLATPSVTTITRENVYIDPGKFVVLSKDSGIYNFYPNLKEGVILVNFANLNNAEDGVVIYDRFGNTIDSVFYNNQFSRKAGNSIERLDYDGPSTSPSNWNYSIASERGTPGFINSRVPKNYDLVLEDIFLTPEFPELGEQITISMYIKNAGLLDVSDYFVIFEADFGVYEEFQGQFIQSGETDLITVSSYYQMQESFTATATINFMLDENLANNSLTKTFYSGYSTASVLINEVLYAPSSAGTEWVELINASTSDINIKDWRIAEGSTYNSPRLITNEDIIVKPGEYIIVADDTSGGRFSSQPGVHLFQLDFGILNTTEDIITIFDFRGALIDSLKYFSSWGATTGISLERLSLDSPTNDRWNWLPSITLGGSTPGTINSTINIKQLEEDQKVVINEIMFNPETDNSEFIEFFNTSDEYIEIANWVVEDAAKNRTNLTRTSFVISPKSYLVVAADSSILFNYPELSGYNQLIIANRNLSLNNSDDLVLLTDAFGETIDSVHYYNDWHNSRLVTTRNKSLERINPFISGNDNNNWSTSTDAIGATPAKENSIYIENKSSNKAIFVTPNPFSPDGDGYEDFTIINYKLPRDVSSIQIKVFDSKGRKVRTINEVNLFGNDGSIIFDGYNDERQPLKMGIYILLIEAVNSFSGTIDTFKEVVVVARKL